MHMHNIQNCKGNILIDYKKDNVQKIIYTVWIKQFKATIKNNETITDTILQTGTLVSVVYILTCSNETYSMKIVEKIDCLNPCFVYKTSRISKAISYNEY